MSSEAERKRREGRLREEMKASGHDVLLILGRDGMWNRGYIRYLTDWHMWAGVAYLVFPLHGEATLVLGSNSMAYWARQVGWVRDVRAGMRGPVPETIKVLQALGVRGMLGVAGLNRMMTLGDVQVFTAALSGVTLVDASGVFEHVRVIKSKEEIDGLTETCQIAAQAMRRFRDVLAPGKTERQVVAEAWKVLRELGCVDGIAHITHEAPPFIRPPADRRIEPTDIIKFSMEVTGPSGYCEELAAVFSFREPPADYRRMFDTVVRAVNRARALLRPGVRGREVAAAVEAVYTEDGWGPLHRVIWDAHGIGLDVIEPPLLLSDEDVELQSGMAISLHPGLTSGDRRLGFYVQDNHIVSPEGGRPLAGWPDTWTVLA